MEQAALFDWTPVLQAVSAFLVLILGAGGTYIVQRLKAEVSENTEITKRVERQTNGQLAKARSDAARWRAMAERYERIVQLVNAVPEGRALIDQVMDRERVIRSDSDFDRLRSRLMNEARNAVPAEEAAHE